MSPQRDVRVPHKGIYAFLALAAVGVCVLAFVASARAATWLLAGLLGVWGIAQLIVPRGALPYVRSRAADAGTCFILAGLILLLSPWAATPSLF